MIKNPWPARAVVVSGLVLMISAMATAGPIQGRVVEAGSSGAADVGIDAVIVRIMDAGDKLLGSTATDETGHYSVYVAANASKATFDKIDYAPQPARRLLDPGKATQDDVFLGKKNQAPAYYQALARAFNQSDRQKVMQYAEIVDALPRRDRDLVAGSLSSIEAIAALKEVEARPRELGLFRQRDMRAMDRPHPELPAIVTDSGAVKAREKIIVN